jgi:hypothetical protein
MSTRVRKKELLSDDFKKRKIFWKNIAENFPPHITKYGPSKLMRMNTFCVEQHHSLLQRHLCKTRLKYLIYNIALGKLSSKTSSRRLKPDFCQTYQHKADRLTPDSCQTYSSLFPPYVSL